MHHKLTQEIVFLTPSLIGSINDKAFHLTNWQVAVMGLTVLLWPCYKRFLMSLQIVCYICGTEQTNRDGKFVLNLVMICFKYQKSQIFHCGGIQCH